MNANTADSAAVAQLGSILSVWAHPDDETFWCAGIMAMAVANGQNVACITATKGEAGVQDEQRWPQDRLGEIRSQELADALNIIGVHHHHWLGYNDGRCHEVDEDSAAQQLATFIDLYQPDSILTFGPDGMTGHSDHQTVSRWVDLAVMRSNQTPVVYHAAQLKDAYEKHLKKADDQFDIFFNIKQPKLVTAADCDVCVCIEGDVCDKKCQALAAMPSQMERVVRHLGKDLPRTFSHEAFIKAAKAD